MTQLRTRYRIVFLYRELRNGKCVETPEFYKLSGAVDGDAFTQYREMALEVYDTIPKKCIIKDGSGVCIVTYQMKETFVFKEKFVSAPDFVYHARVSYILTKNKKGVNIAYKVNPKTGKKTQTNYKKAKKNNTAQMGRIRKATKKYTAKELERKQAYSQRKKDLAEQHRVRKKVVLKQFTMFEGCTSPDMAYKGR